MPTHQRDQMPPLPSPSYARAHHQRPALAGGGKHGTCPQPGRRKLLSVRVLMSIITMLLTPVPALAGPLGEQVRAGTAQVTRPDAITTLVNQETKRAVIDWSSLNLSTAEKLIFQQPGSSSVTLNRVTGDDPSYLYGSITANGQLFFQNPHGIVFGPTARVDVHGLMATTLDIDNNAFMAGDYRFSTPADGATGEVINQGRLTAGHGGYVVLAGERVDNSGVIEAQLGEVALASGSRITLDLEGDQLISLGVDEAALTARAGVKNSGELLADGGRVLMTAKTAGTLATTVVNNQGLVRARTIEEHDGEIFLLGDMDHGQILVGGTLDASAPDGGDGGHIETSAARVEFDQPTVTAAAPHGQGGQWLIDPTDITIDATNVTAYTDSLNSGTDVLVQSGAAGTAAGDITVSTAITKTAGTDATLTLTAHNDIKINATISSTSNKLNLTLNSDSDVSGAGISQFSSVNTIDLNAGTLTSNGGNLNLGGTIKNSTLAFTGGAELYNVSGSLNGCTLSGQVNSSGATMNVDNGLLLADGAHLTTTNPYWYFNGATAAISTPVGATAANATITLNNSTLGNGTTGMTFTLGSGITVNGYGGFSSGGYAGNFINNGTIEATVAGSTMNAGSGAYATTFVNNGTLKASGGTLGIAALDFTNNGTITADSGAIKIDPGSTTSIWRNNGTIALNGGSLDIGGSFTLAGIGTFNRTGGTVNVSGTLDLGGGLLDIGGTGLFGSGGLTALSGGTARLKNGTVVSGDTTALTLTGNADLEAVTLGSTSKPDLTVTGHAEIFNGLSLGGTVNKGNSTWWINGAGTQTIGGSGTLVNAGGGIYSYNATAGSETVQIGPGVTIQGYGTLGDGYAGQTWTNLGTLEANSAGQILTVNPNTFGNSGTLKTSGGTLNLAPTTPWSNGGAFNVASGVLNLGGSFGLAGIGTVNRTGGGINITGILDLGGGTLDIGGTGLFGSGGLTALSGGAARIKNGTVVSGDTTALTLTGNADLDTVTLGNTGKPDLTVSGHAEIFNGLSLGGTVNKSNNTWWINGAGTQTIGGSGTLVNTGGAIYSYNATAGNETVQIGPGVTIQGYGTLGDGYAGQTWTNLGTLEANSAGQILTVNPNTFGNSGTLKTSGGTLNLAPTTPWSNSGTFSVAGGVLNLGGSFGLAGIGTVNRSGGAINITGILDLGSGTLDIGSTGLFGSGGLTALNGGAARIKNGTVVSGDTTALTLTGNADLDTLTLGNTGQPGLTVNGHAEIFNGLSLGGTTNKGNSTWWINGSGTQTIGGSGTLVNTGGAIYSYNATAGSETVQIGPGVTIQGYGTLGDGYAGQTWTNLGTLEADSAGQILTVTPNTFGNSGTLKVSGGTLTIAPATSWSNSGTFSVAGGVLNLGGSFGLAGIGTVNRSGGAVNITGILDLGSGTLDIGSTGLFGSGGLTALNGGAARIKNGTIVSGDTTALTLTGNADLDTLTLGNTGQPGLTVNGHAEIFNGLSLGGTINKGNSTWWINGSGTQAIGGSGTLVSAGGGIYSYNATAGSETVQIGPGVTIQGYGTLGDGYAGQTWTNLGTLEANSAGQILTINPNTFGNSGIAKATGGTLTIAPATSWSNSGAFNVAGGVLNLGGSFGLAGIGTVNRSGGAINITGILDLGGGTLDIGGTGLFGSGGLTALNGGSARIKDGTIVSGDTTALTLTGNADLDTLTLGNTGKPVLTVNGHAEIFNGLSLGGTINKGNNTWWINGAGTQTIGGNGTLVSAGGGIYSYNATVGSETVQIGSGVTIQGYGTLGDGYAGQTWTNLGTINADANGAAQIMTVNPATFSTSGLVKASAGGTLTINPTNSWGNGGTMEAGVSSTISTANHSLTNAAVGIIQGMGTINLGGSTNTLTNNGIIMPGGSGAAGTLSITGNLVNSGSATIKAELGGATAGTQYDVLAVSGSVTLDGTLTSSLINGFSPSGQSFDIITAGTTASGSFTTSSLPSGVNGAMVGNLYRLTHSGVTCTGLCWDGGAGTSNWVDAANWAGDALPGLADLVFINLVTGVDVTLGSGDHSIKGLNTAINNNLTISGGSLTLNDSATLSSLAGSLTLNGGTLTADGALNVSTLTFAGGTFTGAGDLTVNNGFSWSSGTMGGTGKTIVSSAVTNGIIHTSEYGILQPVLERTLTNLGTINHEPGYYATKLTINSGGVLDNQGSYLFTADTGIDGSGGAIINSGTFGKSGGTGSSDIGVQFTNNGGTLKIDSGKINTTAGFSHSGNGNLSGTLGISGGSGTLTGILAGSGTLEVAGGTETLGAVGFTAPVYRQTGGTLTGAGDLTVNNGFYWSSGTMSGTGKTIITAGVTAGTIHTSDYGIAQPILERTLTNLGTINHEPGYYTTKLTINSGGVLNNLGTYLFTADTGIDGSGGAIINTGTFGKSGGTGSSHIGVQFTNNGGTLDIASGTINTTAGFSHSGNGTLNGTLAISDGSGTLTGVLAGSGTLEVAGGTETLGAAGFTAPVYRQTGGTLTGAGDLTVNNDFYWSSGTMSGTGKTIIKAGITAGTIHTSDYGIAQPILERTLTNLGTINHEPGYYTTKLTINSGGVLDNQGSYRFTADTGIDGSGGAIINSGTFGKSGGTGNSDIGVQFTNTDGTLDIASGTINTTAGFSHSGNGTVNGTLAIGGGSGTLTGVLAGSGTLELAGGTVDLATAGFAVPVYRQSGGALTGAGDLIVNNGFSWSSGTMGGAGKTIIKAGVTAGTIHTSDYGIAQPILERTLTNLGTINHEPGYYTTKLTINSGGVLDNQGSYRFTADTGIDGSGGAIINSGTFGKSGGTGSSTIGVAFTNTDGTLDIASGTINTTAGFSHSGNGSLNGTLAISGGSGTLTGVLAGSGTLELAGGTETLGATGFAVPVYRQSGGTLTGTGDLTVNNGFFWSSGTMGGTGQTIIKAGVTTGTIHTTDYGIAQPILERTLKNLGTISHENGYYTTKLTINSGGVLDNQGTYLFSADTGIDGSGGVINNSGTLGKSGGTGNSTISADVTNSGTLRISSGQLDIAGAFANSGTIALSAGSTFKKDGGFTNAGTIHGVGTIQVGTGNTLINNGTIAPGETSGDLTGTLAINGNLTQGASSLLKLDLDGTAAGEYDLVAINGDCLLGGTLQAALSGSYAPANADFLPFLTMGGTASGVFATVSAPPGFTAGYNLAAGEAARLIYSAQPAKIFTNSAGGLTWETPDNWSGATLPAATDDVLLSAGYAVNHGLGNDTINTLTINSANSLALSGGTLTVSGATHAVGDLLVSGGTLTLDGLSEVTHLDLSSGLVNGAGSLTVSNSFSHSGGSVALAGDLAITQASGDLPVGPLNANKILLQATNGGIQVNGALNAAATGDALTLVTNSFTNNVGASALNAANGRWLVWSGDPANDSRGGLVANFKQYHATYGDTTLGNGNGFLYTVAPILTAGLTGPVTKTYDGTTTAILTGANYTVGGAIDGDSVQLNNPVAGSYATKAAGAAKTVTVTGLSATATNGAATVYGYDLATTTIATTTADILPLAITGTITAADKVYDGTTLATIASHSLSGVISGDTVSYSGGSATFSDKNAASGKTVTGTGLVLTGADAANYTVNAMATTTAGILPLAITGTITAAGKVYDGTPWATIASHSLSGAIAGDAVSYSGGSATFSDKNAASGKTVTGTGLTLTGADAVNYTVNSTTTTFADITPLAITCSITASNKVYDGTPWTTISYTVTSGGGIAGDEVGYNGGPGTFTDKNAASGKAVTSTSITLTGADAANYTINTPTTTADITPLAITGSITAADKVYDGNALASITSHSLSGAITGDTVSYSGGSATFSDKNAASGKMVTGTGLTLTGADAGNYTVNSIATTFADITPLAITGSITAAGKVYDGTPWATIASHSLSGAITGDAVNYSGGSATFSDKNAASGKMVTGTGLTLTGADAANYTVNAIATTTADILPLAITGSITAADKVYDGNALATIASHSLSGAITGDAVSYSGGSATFSDKNAANGKTVTGTGLVLTGADAGNYTVNAVATTMADISPAPLTVKANDTNKTYGEAPLLWAFTQVGLVNNETIASVTMTCPGAAATATVEESPYPIVPSNASGGTFSPTNYAITYVPGQLTVLPVVPADTPVAVVRTEVAAVNADIIATTTPLALATEAMQADEVVEGGETAGDDGAAPEENKEDEKKVGVEQSDKDKDLQRQPIVALDEGAVAGQNMVCK